MRKDADLGVRENETADQIVLQITFERATERFFRETAPGLAASVIAIETGTKLFFRHQRLQHRVPYVFREDP